MKSRHQITAFYIEALILILVFVSIILMLTHIFGAGLSKSSEAEILSDSVTLAQSCVEAALSSNGLDELEDILSGSGKNYTETYEHECVEMRFNEKLLPSDASDPSSGVYRVLTYLSEGAESDLVIINVEVYYKDSVDPAYTLGTTGFRKGEAS